MNNEKLILKELYELEDKDKALSSLRFFKTKEGEYGYGDKFLGITVPLQRKIASKYYKLLSLEEIDNLIKNEYHEIRLTTIFILVYKYKKSNLEEQKKIVDLYLNNTKYINNWDLVDSSASYILGSYLYENNIDKNILYELVKSTNLWEQRISIIATGYFIYKNSYSDTINLALLLMNHKHDLIHKAVGWMLREIGKRDKRVLTDFLDKYYKEMPRTMLRYSIEHFNKEEKEKYMKKIIKKLI